MDRAAPGRGAVLSGSADGGRSNCEDSLIRCHCEPVRTLAWQSPGKTDDFPGLYMLYYVYILANAHKSVIYTGVTNDLVRRVYEHKQHFDKNSFTAWYNVDQLVYYESTGDVRAAIEREKQIKSWNRKRKNQLVESMNPKWEDLYDSIL